jgi:hypothetical protein
MSSTIASQFDPAKRAPAGGGVWRGYVIVALLATLFLYLDNFRDGVFFWRVSQQEGGTYIDEAIRILQGEVIYGDFFDFMTPGIFYVTAFFLWLFGPVPGSVGIMIIVLGVVCALLLFAVSDAVLSSYWRYVPAAIFVGLTYPSYSPVNHKWPTMILCLLGILLVVKVQSRLRCALSGIAHGGAMLCTQDFGVGAAFGMVVALWLLRTRKTGADPVAFVLAGGVTVAAILGGIAVVAGFATVWYDLVAFMFEHYGTSHMLAVGIGGVENLPFWLTAFGLGGLGLAYAVVGVARRFWRSDPPSLVIISLAGAGLLVIGGVAHPIEPTLMAVRAVPLTIVAVYVLQRAAEWRAARPWLLVALTLLGLTLVRYAAVGPIRTQFTAPMVMETHRAGRIWSYGWDDLVWLEANTVEGQPVFLFPDKGGFYFLSRTRNPLSYPKLYDMGFSSDAQIADAIRQLVKRCPMVGIWHQNRLFAFGKNRPELDTLKPLEQVLLRNYDVVAEFPNGAIALRRKQSAPGCDTSPSQ